MLKISTTEPKVFVPKKKFQFTDMLVSKLADGLVDINGVDYSLDFLDSLPPGTETVSFSITVELPEE